MNDRLFPPAVDVDCANCPYYKAHAHLTNKEARQKFDNDFWPNVPPGHKIGKGNAYEAFLKACKKVSADTIIAALPKYAAYEQGRQAQDRKGFRPLHPATWLNGERWGDDVEIPPTVENATRDNVHLISSMQNRIKAKERLGMI